MCTDGAGRCPFPMPARRTNSLIPFMSDSMVTEPLPEPRSFGRVALTIVSSEMRAHWSPNFCCRNAGRHPLQKPRVEVSVHPQCLVTWAPKGGRWVTSRADPLHIFDKVRSADELQCACGVRNIGRDPSARASVGRSSHGACKPFSRLPQSECPSGAAVNGRARLDDEPTAPLWLGHSAETSTIAPVRPWVRRRRRAATDDQVHVADAAEVDAIAR